VARRSIELADRSESDQIGAAALELMRTGNHDSATLQHALVMCRSLSRADPGDEQMKRAIRLLQHVTEFLGAPPRLFDARHLSAPEGRP
jgi:DNA-binding Xre family transcriptional regulator